MVVGYSCILLLINTVFTCLFYIRRALSISLLLSHTHITSIAHITHDYLHGIRAIGSLIQAYSWVLCLSLLLRDQAQLSLDS